MAMLYFFGVRSNHHTSHYVHAEQPLAIKMNSVHSSEPVHQPFEIEDKEEKTEETEDDETNESDIETTALDSSFLGLQSEADVSSNDIVISRSQAEYHTPGYVRLRTIII